MYSLVQNATCNLYSAGSATKNECNVWASSTCVEAACCNTITFLLPSAKCLALHDTLPYVSLIAVRFLVVALPPITTSIVSPACKSASILSLNPAASTPSTTT